MGLFTLLRWLRMETLKNGKLYMNFSPEDIILFGLQQRKHHYYQ